MADRSLRVLVAPDSFGGALDSVGVAAAIAARLVATSAATTRSSRRPMADGGEGTLAALADALGDAAERRTLATTDALGRADRRRLAAPRRRPRRVRRDGRRLRPGAARARRAHAGQRPPRLDPRHRRPGPRRARRRRRADHDRARRLGHHRRRQRPAARARRALPRRRTAHELPEGGAALAGLERDRCRRPRPAAGAMRARRRLRRDEPAVSARAARPRPTGRRRAPTRPRSQELDAALATCGRAIEARDRPPRGRPARRRSRRRHDGRAARLHRRAIVRPGVEVVAELVGLAEALEAADLVITGEGRADEQTLQGKTAMGVATLARRARARRSCCCAARSVPAPRRSTARRPSAVVQPIVDRPTDLAERDGRHRAPARRPRPGGWRAPSASALELARP